MLSGILGGGGGSSSSGLIQIIGTAIGSAFAPGAGAGVPMGTGASYAGYARDGGVFESVPGYASGGIAKGRNAGYAAMLHGTEAVVPLPDGNKIPVEMKGGAGDTITNNVTVNISKEGNASTDVSGTGGANDEKLAKALSQAVQEELVKQKRPGGLLSPYGGM